MSAVWNSGQQRKCGSFSMISPDKYYVRHADIAWRMVEDAALLVDPRNGRIMPLNPVAARIWSLLDNHHRLADILSVLVEEFDAPPEKIQQDTWNFVKQLCDANLAGESSDLHPREGS